MLAATEMLRATEAAVVSRVSLRDVHRIIDECILPDSLVSRGEGRHVQAVACVLISFYVESARRLTAEERVHTIRSAAPRLRQLTLPANRLASDVDWLVRDDFLSIDLRPFVERLTDRLARLDAARSLVSVSAEVMGGTPVIRGTRIPVHGIAAQVAAGVPEADILEDHPSLDADALPLAVLYAEAYPLRGRPRPLAARLPEGTRLVVSRRRVPRQQAE